MMRTMHEESAVSSVEVDFGPERVLVVDDDAAVRGYVARALERAGFSVSAHAEAAGALAEARGGDFAVALVDLHMPRRDGRWLLLIWFHTRKTQPSSC